MNANRRDVIKGAAALAAAGPFAASQIAAAEVAAHPYLAYVHPELRAIAAQLLPTEVQPPLSRATLESLRQGMTAYAAGPSPGISYEKRQISGGEGQPTVAVYVVNAGGKTPRPAILHMHGGGYILGTAVSGIAGMQALCKELDCVAVTVDYRLAPETRFRGSIEDNHTALRWLHDNAAALGVDPTRIAVMGESAGGGHAALLAIAARDRQQVPVAFQCLIYPMLDDRTGTSRRVPAHVGKIAWTPDRNRFAWESFLGMAPGGASVPSAAIPARVKNLAGLPPAFIGVGALDLFVDEDIDYALRLNAAGVPTELIVVPGAFHGFDSFGGATRVAEKFTTAKLDALRRGLRIE